MINKRYKTVSGLVQSVYPSHAWSFGTHTRRFYPQRFMQRILLSLFQYDSLSSSSSPSPSSSSSSSSSPLPPLLGMEESGGETGLKMLTNVRHGHGLGRLEIDVYFPDLKLGFEYQDPHHYIDSLHNSMNTLEEIREKDNKKIKLAKKAGITLIQVPYWWDWNPESLIALIKQERPDLLKSKTATVSPISTTPPEHILKQWKESEIPGLGLPMLVMYMRGSFSPENWWIFEKFDGVRAIWNPSTREMYSRNGNEINIPNAVRDSLPPFWLDGELWLGRGIACRNELLSAMKTSHPRDWGPLKYVTFDSPQPSQRESPYGERYNFLKKSVPPDHPYVMVPDYFVCHDRSEVETYYFTIKQQQGEGIILRDPEAPYISGYSRHIYKHRGYIDAEAQVQQINTDKHGKKTYVCTVPKLHIQHNSGEFDTKEDAAEDTPKKDSPASSTVFYTLEMPTEADFPGNEEIEVGNFVSFKYVPGHTPMHAKIHCVRHDISNWQQALVGKGRVVGDHQKVWKPNIKKRWNKEMARQFMDDIARSMGFDPSIPANWNKVNHEEMTKRGGNRLLRLYGGSVHQLLSELYPQLDVDPAQRPVIPPKYFNDLDNRRRFFDGYAATHHFDPLVPDHWYPLTCDAIKQQKNGFRVLRYYNDNLYRALSDVYPHLDLNFLKFKGFTKMKSVWKDPIVIRKYLEQYAADHKFDPLIPENWYPLSQDEIKGNHRPFLHHKFPQGLSAAFPEVQFNLKQFRLLSTPLTTKRK